MINIRCVCVSGQGSDSGWDDDSGDAAVRGRLLLLLLLAVLLLGYAQQVLGTVRRWLGGSLLLAGCSKGRQL